MRRRDFIASSTLALGAIAAPRLGRAAESSVLKFVPQADLTVLDPIFTTAAVTRNHAFLVFDTLYGQDEQFRPQPQMAEGHDVSADGRVWTIRLRPGLKFHDGEPVLAKDCVASLVRWGKRDAFGQTLFAATDELSAVDDRTLRFTMKRPFPLLPEALSRYVALVPVIMPERLAKTDAFTQVTEMVGSGPYRFLANERMAGVRVAYQKFEGYVPRESGTPSWTAGPKRAFFDRVEWQVLPDAGTAAGALQTGEVDWLETPLPDLVPTLERARGIKTGIANDLGVVSGIRLNHLQPPFDNPKVRQAILAAVHQEDYLSAIVGNDPAMRRPMNGFFTSGSPLYTEAGGEVLKAGGDMALAKKLLAESGYSGQKITMLIAQDSFVAKASGDVAVDMCRRLGLNVDPVAIDFGTIQARRVNKRTPPEQGGWHSFQVSHAGTDCINPAAYLGLRANGEKAWFGWPDSKGVEEGIAEWFASTSLEQEKAIAAKINRAAIEDVVFVPTGFFLAKQAWRANVSGVVTAPIPVFWDVAKSA